MSTPRDFRLVHMLRALTPDAGLLFRWLRHAERGTRCQHVVVLEGEARSGKSLIATTLLRRLFGARHTQLPSCTQRSPQQRWLPCPSSVIVCDTDELDPSGSIHALTQLAAQDTVQTRELFSSPDTDPNRTNSIVVTRRGHHVQNPHRVRVVRLSNPIDFASFGEAIVSDAAIAALRKEINDPWRIVRRHVRTRSIAVFWHGLTAHLYAPGGSGHERDRAAFEADFA